MVWSYFDSLEFAEPDIPEAHQIVVILQLNRCAAVGFILRRTNPFCRALDFHMVLYYYAIMNNRYIAGRLQCFTVEFWRGKDNSAFSSVFAHF